MNLTFLLTFAAPLAILAYVICSDRFPEPISSTLKIFFIGVLLIFPAGYLNSHLIDSPSQAYLAGLTEESLKFLAFLVFVSKKIQFNERMDAIVYGVVISLGFATLENYEYVYLSSFEFEPLYIAILRTFTAIPMHAICGVIMGYHFGLRYFNNNSSHLWKALFIPMAIHASYNSLPNIFLMAVFVFFAFFYANSLHKEFMSFQKLKKTEGEKRR